MSVHRVFVAVSGMSPQIVTETLYALAHQSEPWYADEVFLISTVEGADRAEKSLLRGRRLHELCSDYNIPLPLFDKDHILVIKDSMGLPLNDIRSQSDNESAADCMTALLQKLCQSDDTELHVSMAGGRKTMGFHIGYALSMLGRKQDRLSHVLVSNNFEMNPNFYYPTPVSRIDETERFGPMDHKDAQITLVEIPFVRLLTHLNKEVMPPTMSYSALVRHIDNALNQIVSGVSFRNHEFYVAGICIDSMSNLHKAVYYWILQRQKLAMDPIQFSARDSKDIDNMFRKDYGMELLRCYKQVCANEFHEDARVVDRIKDQGITGNDMSEYRTRINKILERYLHGSAAPYLILNSGKRGVERIFSTSLPPSKIQLE